MGADPHQVQGFRGQVTEMVLWAQQSEKLRIRPSCRNQSGSRIAGTLCDGHSVAEESTMYPKSCHAAKSKSSLHDSAGQKILTVVLQER